MKFVNCVAYTEDQDPIAAIRPKHREYLLNLFKRGQVAAAGPFTDGSGGLFIYEADNIDAARALAEADPFALSGVIKQQSVTPWEVVYANSDLFTSA